MTNLENPPVLDDIILYDSNFLSVIGAISEITLVSVQLEDERIKRLCTKLAEDYKVDIKLIKKLVLKYSLL